MTTNDTRRSSGHHSDATQHDEQLGPTLSGVVTAGPQLLFGHTPVARMTGLGPMTLKYWVRHGWLHPVAERPARRGTGGTERFYSGWQLIGLGVIGCAHVAVRERGSLLGRNAVVHVMHIVEQMSDADFFGDQIPNDVVIQVATRLAHLALPDDLHLSVSMMLVLTQCVSAVDNAVKAIKEQQAEATRRGAERELSSPTIK